MADAVKGPIESVVRAIVMRDAVTRHRALTVQVVVPPRSEPALRNALDEVLRWGRCAALVQGNYRCHRALENWRLEAAVYRRAATVLQAAWRGQRGKMALWRLRDQFYSSWEQLLDEATGRHYWFDNATQQSVWVDPGVPFRPYGWWPPDPNSLPVPEGKCSVCRTEDATRTCASLWRGYCSATECAPGKSHRHHLAQLAARAADQGFVEALKRRLARALGH